MVSRREFLLRTGAIGVVTLLKGKEFVFGASHPSTAVNFDVPANACDSHTHIFGDPHRFPYNLPRNYTPEIVSVDESLAVHRALHTQRIVLVQPSVYGSDNSCMLDAMKKLGSISRGIGVIDDNAPHSIIEELDRAGIRGIRANFDDTNLFEADACRPVFHAKVNQIKNQRNWHLQIHTRMSVIAGLEKDLMASPIPLVIDHFGEAKANLGVGQPGFDTLLKLVKTGKAYVKLSAPYHLSTHEPDFSDVGPMAKALVAANPQRVLWGSDWPHSTNIMPKYTDISPFRKIDDGLLFNQFALWVPDAKVRKMILVDNPARLFGY